MARAATHKKEALSSHQVTNRVGQGSNDKMKATVRIVRGDSPQKKKDPSSNRLTNRARKGTND